MPMKQAGEQTATMAMRSCFAHLKSVSSGFARLVLKRPFYPLDLQQECLYIRKTGIGYDGQPILFYNSRQNKCEKSQNQQERKYEDITDTLKKMGLAVSPSKVKNALETLYPDKLAQQSVEGAVIRDLFNYFRKGL